MKNRTEENRKNLDMIAPTWTLLGLALTACGGGGGGGVGSGRVSGPPPINAGARVERNERIPVAQEAPRGSEPIMLVEGMNSIPDLYYRYEESSDLGDGTVASSAFSVASTPDFELDADGNVVGTNGVIGPIMFEVDGLVLSYTEREGNFSLNLRVEIDDYVVVYRDLTLDDVVDVVDDSDDTDSFGNGEAISLTSVWSITYSDGSFSGSAGPHTIMGVPQRDGSIDVRVSLYHDGNGNLFFSSGSGRTLLGSDTYSFNLPPDSPDATGAFDVTYLGVLEGNDYDVPVIFSNLAKDGFGNIEIVARDGSIDSLPEVLEIDADGTTGDVYATGHIWYHDGDVIVGATGSVLIAIERGRYHAEVGVDLDGDRIADILVETPAVEIA